jgi:tRNA(fMet)-specific endonuclease VapC
MTPSGAETVVRLVLDTSAYSHFRAGHPRVLDFIAEAEIVLLPTIVLGELEAGFQLGRRGRENRVLLQSSLQSPSSRSCR